MFLVPTLLLKQNKTGILRSYWRSVTIRVGFHPYRFMSDGIKIDQISWLLIKVELLVRWSVADRVDIGLQLCSSCQTTTSEHGDHKKGTGYDYLFRLTLGAFKIRWWQLMFSNLVVVVVVVVVVGGGAVRNCVLCRVLPCNCCRWSRCWCHSSRCCNYFFMRHFWYFWSRPTTVA